MTPLPGRNVLLTGASGGLGRHIAHALVRAGASVALAGRNAEALDSLALELRCHPGARAEPLICDLTEPDAPRKLAAVAETALGPIDVLVNDAAVELAAPFTAISAEELERILLLDLTVPLQLIRVLLPGMLARHRGHVVNVSSIGGKGAVPYSVPYAAAKWGLIGVTRSLRAEYIDSAVGFSVVCPGFVTGEGIFARAAARGVKAPAALGTTTPQRVADSVILAICRDLPEVIVTPHPIRPMLAFAELAPRTAERLAVLLGTTRFAERAARAEGRM